MHTLACQCIVTATGNMSDLRESKQVVEHAECMLGCKRYAQDSWKRPEISHSDRREALRGGVRKGGMRHGAADFCQAWLETRCYFGGTSDPGSEACRAIGVTAIIGTLIHVIYTRCVYNLTT
jgi:hypothetical protein